MLFGTVVAIVGMKDNYQLMFSLTYQIFLNFVQQHN